MRHGIAFWMICLSLVFTRLLGLHLHACAGVEAGVQHTGTHYADNGFLFGEHHSEDGSDDREVQFVAVTSSKTAFDLPDLEASIPSLSPVPSTAERLLTTAAPRGPPLALPAHPPHFAPPLRGPPSSLA